MHPNDFSLFPDPTAEKLAQLESRLHISEERIEKLTTRVTEMESEMDSITFSSDGIEIVGTSKSVIEVFASPADDEAVMMRIDVFTQMELIG